jgi:hypothetical protein
MKNTLSCADLMVIVDTLSRSLTIHGNSSWSKETRERTMNRVIGIMGNMNVEVVCGEVEPVIVSGDVAA